MGLGSGLSSVHLKGLSPLVACIDHLKGLTRLYADKSSEKKDILSSNRNLRGPGSEPNPGIQKDSNAKY